MLKTVVLFTAGGLFTAVLSNALRGLPLLRKPLVHIGMTFAGFLIGTRISQYEDTFEERMTKAMESRKHAEWYPRGMLLAERAKALGISITLPEGQIYRPDGSVEGGGQDTAEGDEEEVTERVEDEEDEDEE